MAIDLYKNRCAVYDGDKPYIFVSYSHKDTERVFSMILKLQSLGFRIWHDADVPVGADWREAIAPYLKRSNIIILFLSSNSIESRNVKEEFNYAYFLQKPVLVVYLNDCMLTPGFEMRLISHPCIKCELGENDDDLLAKIARTRFVLPCLGEHLDE